MVATVEPWDLYEIGNVARSLGVSAEVIRAWERRKLIQPPRRTASGKRLFTAEEVEAMRAALVARGRHRATRYEATPPLDAA